jgi:N-glycosylase/DNA lyase
VDAGTISLRETRLDLQATLESGQSYLWDRADGRMYDGAGPGWYHTTVGDDLLCVRHRGDHLEWRATADLESDLRTLLGLDDDLDAILASAPPEGLVREAIEAYDGLRIVRDPFFACLVSFICSAQMRVERIHRMQMALRETYGDPVELGGMSYHTFPEPATLAAATEAELRELGLGYRAPYVRDTAELVASGELTRADVAGRPYEAAREALTGFVGVGQKVADCVLLFSLGYLEAIPLDTWIRTAIEEHFPDCDRGSYAETADALRERLGGEYAGYVQTYVFHYLRSGEATE